MTASNIINRFTPLSTYGVQLPSHVLVKPTRQNLLTEFHQYGYDGEQFFGVAFVQGNRLQFTTAMPMTVLHKVAKIDRAGAGSNITSLQKAANRPKIAGHSKALRQYLVDNACKGEKFILPAFAMNFGDESTTPEDAPNAVLWIYAHENENSTNGWPALFQLPRGIKLDATDGAHRLDESEKIVSDGKLTEAQRENLGRNACDVKIIFESKRIDAHQDFADCAKAKPITGSIISSFDVRDLRNSQTVRLVESVDFLKHYVDATAANVNLSAGSLKIWSMSAVRGFVGHVQDRYPPPAGGDASAVESTLVEKLSGAPLFFGAMIKHLPQLHTLELARLEAEARRACPQPAPPAVRTETPATFRNKRGGDVALRGIGMSLFARAFLYAKQHGLSFDHIAQRLAAVDWHVLDCERDDLPNPATEEGRLTFADEVRRHVVPTWTSLIIVGESRYRIGSSNDEANAAWERIKAAHLDPIAEAAE